MAGTRTGHRVRWGIAAVAALVLVSFVAPAGASTEQQQLTAADGAPEDNFGRSVAIDGDTMVMGADFDDVGAVDQGAAYVFTRSGGVWSQPQKLTAADGATGDRFGISVDVEGDTVVVGAWRAEAPTFNEGAVYVFTRSGGVWSQQQKLTASGAVTNDQLGVSVDVVDDTLVAGAWSDDEVAGDAGAAFVFTRSGGVWSQQQKLTAADGAFGDTLGQAVALSADTNTVVAGTGGDDVGANTDQGSAYVFTRSGGVWSQQQKLTAADGAASDALGFGVAVEGDTALVGASGDDVGANTDQGSVYVFTRSGGVWSQQQKLTAADGAASDQLNSVAMAGDTAVLGAAVDDVGANTNQGSAYAFTRSGGVWSQQDQLTASDGAADDQFGVAVGVAGNTVVVGAYADDVGANADQGSAYVFELAGPPAVIGLSPAHAFVGLKNSDDQGTNFDVKVELLKNGTPVASGLSRCVSGVTRNPAQAKDVIVNWDPFTPVPLSAGDVLSFRVSTRIGTQPNDTACGGHASATGLRLYYDAAARQSRFNATTTASPSADVFLHSDGTACTNAPSQGVTTRTLDTTAPTAANAKCQDSTALKFAAGNPWRVIGMWSLAPQI